MVKKPEQIMAAANYYYNLLRAQRKSRELKQQLKHKLCSAISDKMWIASSWHIFPFFINYDHFLLQFPH